jgi:2-polyprenyl-3-methyl-5-hydroxy-6-metoxy-1,4-benzoquinol methylase
VLAHSPTRVLDVGCGEGWLIRALAAPGSVLVGVDASAALIEVAREHNGGAFHLLSYAELAARPEQVGGGFDAVVCNFSLLEEDVVPLLSVEKRRN